jgi:hypothetical protein
MCVEWAGGAITRKQGAIRQQSTPRNCAAAMPDLDFCLKHDLDPRRGRRRAKRCRYSLFAHGFSRFPPQDQDDGAFHAKSARRLSLTLRISGCPQPCGSSMKHRPVALSAP